MKPPNFVVAGRTLLSRVLIKAGFERPEAMVAHYSAGVLLRFDEGALTEWLQGKAAPTLDTPPIRIASLPK